MAMTFHEVANIFPLMAEPALDDLATDIAAHGLREPITLHPNGEILDGRNRYLACQRAGVEPTFRTWSGEEDSLVAFSLSLNLHRRQLSVGQRALVAARIATLKIGRPINASREALIARQSDSAALLGVGRSSVQRAQHVLAYGGLDLIQAVEDGRVTVAAAGLVSTLPTDEQRALLGQGDGAVATAAERLRARPPRAPAPPALAPPAPMSRAGIAARHARIRTMAEEGYNSSQIAAEVGISLDTVRQYISRNKIECLGDRSGSNRPMDGARILEHIVTTAEDLTADERLIDFATLDPDRVGAWVTALLGAQRRLTKFIARLTPYARKDLHVETEEARVEGPSRPH